MGRLGRLLLTVIAAITLVQPLALAGTATLTARIVRGQSFTGKLAENLWFCLFAEKDGSGWWIAVQQDCTKPDHDFVAVATPPMHGPNPREILGWHFEAGANAPQNVRDFSFVLKDADWQRLMTDLNSYTDASKMLSEIDELGRGRGTLRILAMKSRREKDQPVIDWMKFRVELRWPDR